MKIKQKCAMLIWYHTARCYYSWLKTEETDFCFMFLWHFKSQTNLFSSSIIMVSLGYQFNYIKNQLNSKQLGVPMWNFPEWIKTHPISGPHLLVTVHIKEHGSRELLLFCLFIVTFVDEFNHAASLKESSGPPAPDWNCWDIQSCKLNNYKILGL